MLLIRDHELLDFVFSVSQDSFLYCFFCFSLNLYLQCCLSLPERLSLIVSSCLSLLCCHLVFSSSTSSVLPFSRFPSVHQSSRSFMFHFSPIASHSPGPRSSLRDPCSWYIALDTMAHSMKMYPECARHLDPLEKTSDIWICAERCWLK